MTNKKYLLEIFERVKTHLLTQKKRSTVNGACFYRGPDGLMCAVGCLITDEAYNSTIEDQPAFMPEVKNALHESGIIMSEGLDIMLGDLQGVHDGTSINDWQHELEAVRLKIERGHYND